MELPIKLVIIEDDKTIREGLSLLINHSPDFIVVNAYPSFEDAIKNIISDSPKVILLDIELPGVNGLDAIAKIKSLLPKTFILMLSIYENPEFIFKALALGANGYLTKNMKSEKIMDAIKEVINGGGPMSPQIARLVIESFKLNESPLTKRETEILEQISYGKSRSRIAAEMFIDAETVKTHIKNIYLKLDVHSKADALRVAKEKRII